MTLTELTRIANNYADEQYDEDMTADFVNEAIAKINISLDIELPYFSVDMESYSNSILKETWQRILFIPYILYSIKANDGSQNESILALQKFNENLKELKRSRSFDIPKKYRLRWFETTEYEYNLSEHKAPDYNSLANYEIDTEEILPKFGTDGVIYEDSFIRVNLASEIKKYYKLQDNKQAAVFKVGKGW